MFGIFHKRSKQDDIISGLRKSTDVERFTNAFIVQIVCSKTALVRVRRSEGLPKVQTTFGEAVASDWEKVVNRLKVCSMLDPVRYGEPVSGSFGFFCPEKDGQVSQVKVETFFDDREPDPFFEVRIAKDASYQVTAGTVGWRSQFRDGGGHHEPRVAGLWTLSMGEVIYV